MSALPGSHSRQVLQFVGLLFAQAKSKFHFPLPSPVLELQANGRAGLHSREFVIEERVRRFAVDGGDAISGNMPARWASLLGSICDDFRLTAQVCRGGEASSGDLGIDQNDVQAGELEEIVVGNLLHAGHVVAKEIVEALAGNGFRRLLDTGESAKKRCCLA